MNSSLSGHHLMYGIATSEPHGGLNIIASSTDALLSHQRQLVEHTNIGKVQVNDFPGAFGYFGRFEPLDGKWAVLARVYKSLKPDNAGRPFIQRDIFLVPFVDYEESGADAAAWIERLPEPSVVERSGKKLPPLEVEPFTLELTEERFRPLGSYEISFVEQMLAAVICKPTIVFGKNVAPELLEALLLLLPPTLRAATTSATLTGEAAASIHLRIMVDFPKTAEGAAVIDLGQRRLLQPIEVTAAAKDLVASWRLGMAALAWHHKRLDRNLPRAARSAIVEELPTANGVARSFAHVLEKLSGQQKWQAAVDHLDVASTLDDRADLVQAIVGHLQLPAEEKQFTNFLRALKPKPEEKPDLEEMLVTRYASDAAGLRAAATAVANGYGKEEGSAAFVTRVVNQSPESIRSFELAVDLAGTFQGASMLASTVRVDMLQRWTFSSVPVKPEHLCVLLDFLRSSDEVAALRKNAALVKQIRETPGAPIALSLTEISVLQPAGQELTTAVEALLTEARRAPKDAVRATTEITTAHQWRNLPAVALPFAAALISAGVKNDEIDKIFVDAYSDADGALFPTVDTDELTNAKTAVNRNEHARNALLTADVRRAVAEANAELREKVQKTLQWDQAKAFVEVARPADGNWYASPLAWYAAACLASHRGTPETFLQNPSVRASPLLTMAALIAAAHESDLDLEQALVEAAVAARPERPPGLGRRQWLPQSWATLDFVANAMRAFFGHNQGDQVQRVTMRESVGSTKERTVAIKTLLRRFSDLAAQLSGHDGYVNEILGAAARNDLSPEEAEELQRLVQQLIKTLESSAFDDRSLVQQLKELQKWLRKSADREERSLHW
jgi:hypothetical protein